MRVPIVALFAGLLVTILALLGCSQTDTPPRVYPAAGDQQYDVVFDAVDKLAPEHGRKALKSGGVYLNVDKSSDGCHLTAKDLVFLKELAEDGKLRAVIDRRYPWEEIVEAHRYVDNGQ